MKSLDVLLESISDDDWRDIKLKVESKRAHQSASIFKAKRESAINFGDWLLKKNLVNGYDDEGSSCWVVPDGKGNTYTTLEIYNIYITGQWEEDENEEDENED
jgi:predicted choloylglycine hydrolase